MFSIKKIITVFGAFIFIACNESSSESSYEAYEPTPLTSAQIEAEAESFYLENRYTFKKWVESVSDGNEYDQKAAQRNLDDIMIKLLTSNKYADGDASEIWRQALNIASTKDN
ncbi:hypothetical protein OAL58_02845 [Verrucomicrobia bacterium]|nr:hypothetical protein [Verrucomicrobiota bacterium]